MSGTNTGAYRGLPAPTGQHFESEAIAILRIADGRVAELRGTADRLGNADPARHPSRPGLTARRSLANCVPRTVGDSTKCERTIEGAGELALTPKEVIQ
jgi:hypothetical protein